MTDRSFTVVFTASDEIDDHLRLLAARCAPGAGGVSIIAPGYSAGALGAEDVTSLCRVTLVPKAPPGVPPSEQPVRLIRIAHNLLLLNPWRLLSACLWVDTRWALLQYPELVACAIDLRPTVVCADGREMLKAARQVAIECGARLVFAPRDEQADKRLGAAEFAWFHWPLLAIREAAYRSKAERLTLED